MHRVTLVGSRASGKSTVGARLAEKLGAAFVDADRMLEARVGCAMAELFRREGESGMRAREAALLAELLTGDGPKVVATGGGCVLLPGNRELLRRSGGLVVYLRAPAAALAERLRRDAGGRPSLTGVPVADEVERLLAVREPLYREVAAAEVDATREPAAVVDEVARLAGGVR